MKRTPIRQRSKKRAKLYREERVPLVEKFMAEHPLCQRCLSARSTDPHEPLTRARGGSITDENNLVALCAACHLHIHLHPKESEEQGWLKSGKRKIGE